jgi:predicted nuclease of predicted toxin-antitoxin system
MPLNNFQYWIDANLPPQLAVWLNEKFSVQAYSLKELKLLQTADKEIYNLASKNNIIIFTKDEDFAEVAQIKRCPAKSNLGYSWQYFKSAT